VGSQEPSLHFGNFSGRRDITRLEADIRALQLVDDTAAPRDDEQLMLDVQAGKPDAARRLFEAWRQPVWGFFCRRVRPRERAEELTHDVFAAILEAAPRYQPRGAFRSYLFGIAFNVLMADRRKRAVITETLGEYAAEGADPDEVLWVRQALQQLDPVDREVLMLREYEQLSYQEIADLQALPLNTVRSRLFRARLALRDALVRRPGL
jgi:RNA polymerase sigma-70 factor (ECF subfamily)